MAKSDLLKEAIADARTVKETALANAKIALQEAFAPRLESMLNAQFQKELGEEEMPMDDEAGMEPEAGLEDEAGMGDIPDSVGVGLDFNDDGEYDLSGTLGSMDDEEEALPAEDEVAPEDEYEDDDLDLQEIIRELEGDMDTDIDSDIDPEHQQRYGHQEDEVRYKHDDLGDFEFNEGDEYGKDPMHGDIDEIIESLLREEDEDEEPVTEAEEVKAELEDTKKELGEAYKTVKQMQRVIQEVNLLNAKLLYTNKLFRNFDLNENQKMKVLENFDRAGNTREVKLVFSTLAESFNRPTKKRVVKESYASKPVRTTAPVSRPILNEGFELADRWKKLAGLL